MKNGWMKKWLLLGTLAAALAFVFASCNSDEDGDWVGNGVPDELVGKWKSTKSTIDENYSLLITSENQLALLIKIPGQEGGTVDQCPYLVKKLWV